jgi:hypothetical protein
MTKKEKKKPEETDEEIEERESEAQQDAEFMLSARHAPRQGIYEHLLSQFLAQAVIVTDPLKRVKIVCEAAFMIPEAERSDLAVDYEKIEVLNVVANALLNPTNIKIDFGDLVSLSWGFNESEENFSKFVTPWAICRINYWPTFLKTHVKMHRDYYNRIVVDEIIRNPLWSWFFDATSCLSTDGYASLRNNFAAWAIPQVQLYLAELTKMVSPNLYNQILGLYEKRGKKGYAEKVKETAKETVEGLADEDSMGPY